MNAGSSIEVRAMNRNYRSIEKTLPHVMRPPVQGLKVPSLEEAVKYIDSMDFSLIKRKLMSSDRLLCRQWTSVEVDIAVQYYKNFLFLNKKYIQRYSVLPPLLEVDEVWHHHIMDTRQYAIDCEGIFGYFFHHYPYFGTRSKEDEENLQVAFDVVQELHAREFGRKMIAVWGVNNAL